VRYISAFSHTPFTHLMHSSLPCSVLHPTWMVITGNVSAHRLAGHMKHRCKKMSPGAINFGDNLLPLHNVCVSAVSHTAFTLFTCSSPSRSVLRLTSTMIYEMCPHTSGKVSWPSHTLNYHLFRLLDVPMSCLHKRSKLSPLNNAMIRCPANIVLTPRAPAHLSHHPARYPIPTWHEQGHLLVGADRPWIAHSECPPAPWELGWCEHAGDLPLTATPQVCQGTKSALKTKVPGGRMNQAIGKGN